MLVDCSDIHVKKAEREKRKIKDLNINENYKFYFLNSILYLFGLKIL